MPFSVPFFLRASPPAGPAHLDFWALTLPGVPSLAGAINTAKGWMLPWVSALSRALHRAPCPHFRAGSSHALGFAGVALTPTSPAPQSIDQRPASPTSSAEAARLDGPPKVFAPLRSCRLVRRNPGYGFTSQAPRRHRRL
jgi:hypothetical protein